jgi:tetratricopeptide (TPR) repeat protein
VTQEFNISVTPIGGDEYLVRTEWTPDVTAAEERVCWPVDEWLAQASVLMHDPLLGVLRGDGVAAQLQAVGEAGPHEGTISLVEFGQNLYNALFQGMLRDSWMRAQGIAQHRREVLRLRLGLKDQRLPCLPWEVLHAGDRPLATGTDVAFSRYHTKCAPLVQSPFVEIDEPLRILMVLAAPSDQEQLALRQEAKDLKYELESTIDRRGGQIPDIKVEILDQPDRAQLTQALEHQQYQVLHYAGHSNIGAAGGCLYLVSRTTGLTETLTGDDLAGLLVNNGIRMAVFNSCRGVYTATAYPSQGQGTSQGTSYGEGNLAEALVKRGIPAVLAMAERIPDDVALNLSRLFYRNLRRAYPVDLSLNRARQGLVSIYGSHQLYWALPTLYMHPEFNGFLQPLAAEVEDAWVSTSGGRESEADVLPKGASFAQDLENPFDAVSYPDSELERDDFEGDDFKGNDFDTVDLPQADVGSRVTPPTDQLVEQLSRGDTRTDADRFSPASLEEDLLPDLPTLLHAQGALRGPSPPAAKLSDDGTEAASFSELEGMLADTNRLTHAIAACIQATQRDPNDASAYRRLGQVLATQGHLSEAIAAYDQALQLNPHFAEVHNDLGMVLAQQGQTAEAMRAYSMAVRLNPSLMEAQHNLRTAQQRHSGGLSAAAPGMAAPQAMRNPIAARSAVAVGPERSQPSSPGSGSSRPKLPVRGSGTRVADWPWPWLGGGILGMAVLTGAVWFTSNQMHPPLNIRVVPVPPTAVSPGDNKWQQMNTGEAAAAATRLLEQGQVAEAQPILQALLDRGALKQAEAALNPVLAKQAENPTINFLVGQLAWRAWIVGDKTYAVDDARRRWETAIKLQPDNPTYQNALGFAYYEEGKFDRAGQAWLRTLELLGKQPGTPATAGSANLGAAPEALHAYAGLALTLAKTAEKAGASNRAEKMAQARTLRQQVMTAGGIQFSPTELARDKKNWLWSEKTIQDWQALQAQ